MIVKYIVRNMQKISYYGKTHIYLQNDLFSVKIQMWVNQIKPSTIKEIFLCCVISSNTYIWCVFWIICHKGSVGLLDAFLTTIFWCLKNSAFTTSLGAMQGIWIISSPCKQMKTQNNISFWFIGGTCLSLSSIMIPDISKCRNLCD